MGRGFAGRARAAGRCGARSITAAQAAALDPLALSGFFFEEDLSEEGFSEEDFSEEGLDVELDSDLDSLSALPSPLPSLPRLLE